MENKVTLKINRIEAFSRASISRFHSINQAWLINEGEVNISLKKDKLRLNNLKSNIQKFLDFYNIKIQEIMLKKSTYWIFIKGTNNKSDQWFNSMDYLFSNLIYNFFNKKYKFEVNVIDFEVIVKNSMAYKIPEFKDIYLEVVKNEGVIETPYLLKSTRDRIRSKFMTVKYFKVVTIGKKLRRFLKFRIRQE